MIDGLRKIFGELNASDNKLDQFIYCTDASRIEGHAAAVVFPKTSEEVQKAVRFAKRFDKVLVPRGSGTNVVGGCVPEDSIVMDMSKMDRVYEVNPDHVIVEAGVLVGDLNKRLRNKVFPFEDYNASTIGGLIARNAVDKRARENGRLGDWVLELEVIDGSGKYSKLKEERLKHFIGMEGTTGIILTAKLKIKESPKGRTLSLMKFNTISSMMEKIRELGRNPNITFIEYWDVLTSELVGLESKNHLFVEYNNDEGEIKDREETEHLWVLRNSIDPILKTFGFIENECPEMPENDLDKYLFWLNKQNIPSIGQFFPNFISSYFKRKEMVRNENLKIITQLNGKVSSKYGTGLKYKSFVSEKEKKKLKLLKEHYDFKDLMNRGKIA